MRRAHTARRMHIAMVSETYPPEVNGVARTIEVTGLPLFAHVDDFVGAVAIFWES